MSNVSSWSTTAASNNTASPDGWPENMAPSGVNNSARENMAALAKWYACIDGSLTTTGSANAYVLSTGSSHAALADIGFLVFKTNFTNTGACTLAVDGLAATNIFWNGAALGTGSLVSGSVYAVVYNGTSFELVGNPVNLPSLVSSGLTYPTADGTSQQAIVTNGAGALSFASLTAAMVRSARTSDTILAVGDLATFVEVTSGTFTQTVTAAATLGSGWYLFYLNSGTGIVTIDPNGAETIGGASTLALNPGDGICLQCDGSNFNYFWLGYENGTHEVVVTTGNGHGSTNTAIRRFTTALVNTGTAITYADSAANGATFTINETATYSISYVDSKAIGPTIVGISVDSAQLTTSVTSITAANRLGYADATGNNEVAGPSIVVGLTSGAVIRAHTDGAPDATSAAETMFRIKKIGAAR